jgi:energy-coupling factor transporter ATP-binding protein EcfA2
MRITEITTSGFQPFRDQRLAVYDVPQRRETDSRLGEVQFFLGPNGSGKSRMLAALAGMAGNLTPLKNRLGEPMHKGWQVLASLDNGTTSLVGCPLDVSGFHQSRHPGIAFAYSGGCYLKNAGISQNIAVTAATAEERLSFIRTSTYSDRLAQAVYNLKLEAAQDFMNRGGSSCPLEKMPRYERIVHSLESRLSNALDCQFSFRASTRPAPMLAVDWNRKTLQFDQLPDGLRMAIGWVADVAVMIDLLNPKAEDPLAEPFTLLLDEPENHLHPRWQRQIIPLAQRLFPNAQMFIATHSPFIVMSVNEGWIHRFEMGEDGLVTVQEPKPAEPGDSYVSVLRDIMGVPERFDDESEKLMADFRAAKEEALDGKQGAEERARNLLGQIALRGEELGWIARAELEQLNEELNDPVPA